MKIDELYFGVRGYTLSMPDRLMAWNLFNSTRVKRSVAIWASTDPKKREEEGWDFGLFCFGDVKGRVQYEMYVHPIIHSMAPPEEIAIKTDIYTMFVEPNLRILREMVDQVSVAEAKRWLKLEKESLL